MREAPVQGSLDRAADRRADPDWVAARLADRSSRAVVATAEGVLVDGDAPALVSLGSAIADGAEPILIGIDDRGAVFAVDPGSDAAARLRPGASIRSLREAMAAATQAGGGLMAHAVALLNWQRGHRFCSRCGAGTRSVEAGHARACSRCGALHHPRTDPVVIMLVHDGDRLLLGREPGWPAGMYSTLAGFVEPGETPEQAVAREVREEAGVEVRDVRYHSAQPWPFPMSLMLGFEAAYAGGVAGVRDAELQDVRWMDREELERVAAGQGPLVLPPAISIARRLIDGWLAFDRSESAGYDAKSI